MQGDLKSLGILFENYWVSINNSYWLLFLFIKFRGSGKPSISFFKSPDPNNELFSYSNFPNYPN